MFKSDIENTERLIIIYEEHYVECKREIQPGSFILKALRMAAKKW